MRAHLASCGDLSAALLGFGDPAETGSLQADLIPGASGGRWIDFSGQRSRSGGQLWPAGSFSGGRKAGGVGMYSSRAAKER